MEILNRFVEWYPVFMTNGDPNLAHRLSNVRQVIRNHLSGQNQKARRDYRTKKTTDPFSLNPPSPEEICRVVRVAEPRARALFQRAEHHSLNQHQITFLNQFLTSWICLTQAQRPGICQ